MANPSFMNEYLNGLNGIQPEVRRNFFLMTDLDTRCNAVQENANVNLHEYMENIDSMSSEEKAQAMNNVKEMFAKMKSYSDDKIQLSIQTYEFIDKQIRKLDDGFERYDARAKEITEKANEERIQNNTNKKRNNKKVKNPITFLPSKNSMKDVNWETTTASGTGKVEDVVDLCAIPVVPPDKKFPVMMLRSDSMEYEQTTEPIDMPVDPNEPRYCICNQVSYGEMIGCDNSDCPVEWFHFPCVGLFTKPKGKWFCPKCLWNKKMK